MNKTTEKKRNRSEVVSVLLLILFVVICLLINMWGNISHTNLCLLFVGGILVINTLFFFVGQQLRIVPMFFCGILLLIMGTAYSVDESNPDLDGYLRAYNYLLEYGLNHIGEVNADTNGGSDFGFLLLMWVLGVLGFSYNGFVTVLALISVILIQKGIKRIGGNYGLILSCYALMSFTYDCFQIRFFFAYSIIIYGLKYILQQNKEKRMFLIFLAIAMFFHFSSVFFLILLITPKFLAEKYKIIIGGFLVLFAMAYLNIGSIMTIFASLIPTERLLQYANQGVEISIFTSAFVSVIVIAMILITGHIYKKSKSSFAENLLRLNIICSVLIPILPLSLDFERFLRPVLMYDYAVISSPMVVSKKKRYLFSAIIILLAATRVSVMVNSFTKDIIQNNYFMDFLFS